MKWSLSVASMVVMFVTASLPAGAAVFTGTLTGAAEDPPNASEGTGPAEVELDEVEHVLRIDVSFSGLMSPTTIAHIHCCVPPGENAGVATTVPTFPGFPADVTSGTYQMTFDTTQESTFNPGFISANGGTAAGAEAALLAGLNAGMAYFNIHTMTFGGGEIRANLGGGEPATPTATPGTPVGTATATITPGTPGATETPGTPGATETPGTPGATETVSGEATATSTATPSLTLPTATATRAGGSPTMTGGVPVSTATATPIGGGVRTATRAPGAGGIDDDSCAIVAPQRSGVGDAWFLFVPAALLFVARRRRW